MSLRPFAFALLVAPLALAAMPAAAQQQSESYRFLQAVKDQKNSDVVDFVEKPGSTVINTRDVNSGEGALHIVIKAYNMPYLNYLLDHGANPNVRDNRGVSPLMLAVNEGHGEMIPVLIAHHADPDLGNAAGETPLIRAVQRHDIEMVRTLLAAGADPDRQDRLAGLSARAYAKQDARYPAIARVIDAAPPIKRRAVAGPKL